MDLTNLEGGTAETTNHPDSSRSYGGPTMYQHRSTILCSFCTVVLLAVTIGLSAVSLDRSDEALTLALANEEAAKEMEAELQESNQAVVDAIERWEQRPVTEVVPRPLVVSTSGPPSPPIPKPTPKPTPTTELTTAAPPAPPPTASPTEPHPLNPRWYHTSHKDYQAVLATQETAGQADENGELHPWLLVNMFCGKQSLAPCGYDAYCPNGKDGRPYRGGPPQTDGWEDRKQEQWSPIAAATEEEGFGWLQVGYVPSEDGGKDGSQCVKWEDFEYGNGEDILEVRGEPYMQWMLCCENPDMSGGGT